MFHASYLVPPSLLSPKRARLSAAARIEENDGRQEKIHTAGLSACRGPRVAVPVISRELARALQEQRKSPLRDILPASTTHLRTLIESRRYWNSIRRGIWFVEKECVGRRPDSRQRFKSRFFFGDCWTMSSGNPPQR